MQTMGFIGVGKIGLPIWDNLIKSGYSVLGYRRGSLADFEKLGGVPAKSPADVGAQCDIVFSCLPTTSAGRSRQRAAGPDQFRTPGPDHRRVRLASRPGQAEICRAACREGRGFSRRRGERHARHGGGAQGRDLSRRRCRRGKRSSRLSRASPIFACISAVRRRDQGQAGQQFPGRHAHRGTAQAMALGLKAGVDNDLLIKAVATGSGGSTAFGIRAPWMAQRKFHPVQGAGRRCCSTISTRRAMANETGIATAARPPIELYQKRVDMASAIPRCRGHGRV